MKSFIIFLSILFPFSFISQYHDFKKLEANAVSVRVNNNGSLFNDRNAGVAGYEIPKGSKKNVLYYCALSVIGKDENGILRYSILRYTDEFTKSGPFSTQSNLSSNSNFAYDFPKSIWKISKEQIAIHRANYNNPDYVIPEDILYWPGNGDAKYGLSQFIAPFVDVNGDDVYSPENGDYPLIKGDESVFFVMNDQGYQSPNNSIDLEICVMLSQFKKKNTYLDSTTFVSYKLINKGVHTYDSLYTAFFIDADVGSYQDDYAGTDVLRNMMYFYNGDNNDETNSQNVGYGLNPPAVGVKVLNTSITSSTVFTSTATYPYSDPLIATQFYNFMKGKWADGSEKYYGGQANASSTGVTSISSNFMYTGESDLSGTLSTNGFDMSVDYPNGWYEATVNNPPGDRRGLLANKPSKFKPNDELIIDYAVLYGRSSEGQLLSSVNRLTEVADSCQNYYDNTPILQIFENITTDTTDYSSYNDEYIPEATDNNRQIYNGPKLKRVSGYGNGGNYTELTQNCIDSIVKNGYVNEIEYKKGCGPIHIEIIDSSAYQEGDYIFQFYDYSISNSNSVDSAKWRISRTNTNGTYIYESQFDISVDTFEIIPELGLKVKAHQVKYSGLSSKLFSRPISSSIKFKDTTKQWLTFIKDNYSFSPTNWIRSGITQDTSETAVPAYTAPACYKDEMIGEVSLDEEKLFNTLVGGGVAPYRLTGYQCDLMPFAYYNNALLNSVTNSSRTAAMLAFLPSVDIVLTSDQSKWTRCPVFELGRDENTNFGNAKPGGLRKSLSVGKDGLPDGTGTGMSWFPGYAIDLETGARLFMAFGENSFLGQDNGLDMIWNPTDRFVDMVGRPVLGGQHPIYVYSYKNQEINSTNTSYDFPFYTEDNNEVYNLMLDVETGSPAAARKLYGSMSWIANTILNRDEELLATDVTIKLRMEKEFKYLPMNNINDYMLVWSHDKFLGFKDNEKSQNLISVYPNPSNDEIYVKLQNFKATEYSIIDQLGKRIKTGKIESNELFIDIKDLKKGVYIINLDGVYSKSFVKM